MSSVSTPRTNELGFGGCMGISRQCYYCWDYNARKRCCSVASKALVTGRHPRLQAISYVRNQKSLFNCSNLVNDVEVALRNFRHEYTRLSGEESDASREGAWGIMWRLLYHLV